MVDAVARAREAFAARAWGTAYSLLAGEDRLEAGDLERLAVAAYLVGRDEPSDGAWERAHLEYLAAGDHEGAARCAGWLGFGLLLRGDMARASGWFGRATSLVDEHRCDGSVRGILLMPEFLYALEGGDLASAGGLADEMYAEARRCEDDGLLALSLLCRGEAALARQESTRGMKLLDEAMVVVTSGNVPPISAGIVYCAVVDACMEVSDLQRAAEWTEALDRWCASQPDLVPYRGQCLVHRAQILRAHGNWAEAAAEAERARRRLSEPAHPALGLALYEQGEIHRVRGELDAAERAYRAASEQGREPAPGMALLRLAQGRIDLAVAAARRMVEESHDPFTRPRMLAASVEILLAAGEVETARTIADELAVAATSADAPFTKAMAAYATGSVLLAAGDPSAALAELRRAHVAWRALDVPYDAARARVQVGLACRRLGDEDAARLELDSAHAAFERLGARDESVRVGRLVGAGSTDRADRADRASELTQREREVLRLVAAGRTNREIAAALFISDHTVGRHLQNIFTKLGVSSRAAATAYAYEHGIV
jgi:ATP/maltotriose-dependent transcriptional regulator MalT